MSPPLHLVIHRTDRSGRAVDLALSFPSDLALVGQAVDLIARQCQAGPLSPRRLFFNLRTALAEALANAITYGNAGDPGRLVRVRVVVSAEAVRIDVVDEGAGFAYTDVPDPTTPDNLTRENGRGLFVMRHLVDDVAFNAKGNGVCLILKAG